MHTLNKLRSALAYALDELELKAGDDTLGAPEVIAEVKQALVDTMNIVATGIWTKSDIEHQWQETHEERESLTDAELIWIGAQLTDEYINKPSVIEYPLVFLFSEVIANR